MKHGVDFIKVETQFSTIIISPRNNVVIVNFGNRGLKYRHFIKLKSWGQYSENRTIIPYPGYEERVERFVAIQNMRWPKLNLRVIEGE